MSFNDRVVRYRARGYHTTGTEPGGVRMVKPKRVSVVWMLCTGVLPYLIYHVFFKSERSVFVASDDEA